MPARLCRECGCEIRAENIVHGRSAARSLWWVHTATGRVACPPHRRAEHRRHTSTSTGDR